MGRKPKYDTKMTGNFQCRIDYSFENILKYCVKMTGNTKTDVIYEALEMYYETLKNDKK